MDKTIAEINQEYLERKIEHEYEQQTREQTYTQYTLMSDYITAIDQVIIASDAEKSALVLIIEQRSRIIESRLSSLILRGKGERVDPVGRWVSSEGTALYYKFRYTELGSL